MIEEVLDRFKLLNIGLSRSDCKRESGWVEQVDCSRSLSYRVDYGSGFRLGIFELESTDNEMDRVYRFTVTLSCHVYDSEHLPDLDEQSANTESVEPVARVLCEYDADYIVQDDSGQREFEKADLISFSQHNVVYHVWPYFREHVQGSLSKMNVSSLTLHTLRVPVSNRLQRPKK